MIHKSSTFFLRVVYGTSLIYLETFKSRYFNRKLKSLPA